MAQGASAARRPLHLSSLDALRVGATMLVLLYHVHTVFAPMTGIMPFGGVFQSGSSRGVDLFFVLSGFVILWRYGDDIGRSERWAYYMSRRLLRIYPPALIMTAFAIIMYASGFGGPEKASKLEFHNLVLSLLLMAERSSSVLNVAWTLKYVVFFYVLFGVAVMNAALGIALILVWQACVVLHAYAGLGGAGWDTWFLQPMGLELGMGIVAAVLVSRLRFRFSPFASSLLLAGGIVCFVGFKLIESYVWHHDLPGRIEVWIFGVSSALMIAGLALLDLHSAIRLPRIMPLLGKASLSVYLVNYSVIVLIAKAMQIAGIPIGNTLAAFAVAGAAVCCGLLFHALVDQPVQRKLGLIHKRIFVGGRELRWSAPTA